VKDTEATEFTRILYKLYNSKNLEYEPARKEYIKIFTEFEFDIAQQALDNIYRTHKYNSCPVPADIYDECKKAMLQNKHNTAVDNKELDMCYVCRGKGYIIHTKIINETPYQYVLHCTECKAGALAKYDGRRCKRKSEYYTEPVTKYYDVEELKTQNIFSANKGVVPMPDYVKRKLMEFGIKMGVKRLGG